MTRFGALFVCLAMAACATASGPAPEAPVASMLSLIPAPASISFASGSFTLAEGTPIVVDPRDRSARAVADYLSDLARRTRGLNLPVADAGSGIRLRRVRDIAESEGYRLSVNRSGVTLEAGSDAGLFYAAITLWQLISESTPSSALGSAHSDTAQPGGLQLPALEIADSPRFAWRGMLLDSARQYQSPAFIRQFIDVMALHKLNVLHWHLTDDQAWRLQIRRYPRLTEVGAWRIPAGAGPAADIDPATGRPRLYGGFYSQDDVRALVAYAAARHITIVPEIEMPGHSTAAIAAYPELGVEGARIDGVPADWGVYQNLYNVDETTFTFLENVLAEVLELFPSTYIHVGGDEVVKTQWERSPRVQARMRALGVADGHALQSYFIGRMSRYLEAHGRRLIGWDEILEGGLAPNASVMSWRGVEGAINAARAGHDAVLAAWPTLYFDNRQSTSPAEPPGRGRVVGYGDVYSFDPAPASLSPDQQRHILGVQGNVWTEHIRTEARVMTMTFPRAAAIAELGWSPHAASAEDFARRVGAWEGRYRALGVAPWTPTPAVAPDPRHRVSQELETCADKIVLNLEDDAPVLGERAVFLIDVMQPCWIWRNADLSDVTAIRAAVGQVPFNFQIGDEVNSIHFRRPATRSGELEVRLGCDGARIAAAPLAPAARNPGVTILPDAPIRRLSGTHDLCFTFTARGVDPMYAIQSLSLETAH